MVYMKNYAGIMKSAAQLLEEGKREQACKLLQKEYPFLPKTSRYNPVYEDVKLLGLPMPTTPRKKVNDQFSRNRRNLSYKERFEIFERDGFRCSYSGIKLVLPPALLLLSLLMPEVFPCKKYYNCPLSQTHVGIWTLFPSPDHVKPFSVGGTCTLDNIVTTSNSVNLIKANYSLEDLMWNIPRSQDYSDNWDGLGGWFLRMIDSNPSIISDLLKSPKNEEFFRNDVNGEKFFRDWIKVLEFSLFI
jgi:hypothetical protein